MLARLVARGLRKKQLAGRAGISVNTVTRAISGGPIDVGTAASVARVLRCRVADILEQQDRAVSGSSEVQLLETIDNGIE